MTIRIRDAVRAAEQARQRARLFSEARHVLARRYLGNADPSVSFGALSQVLEHLLLAANAAEQDACRQLSAPIGGASKAPRPRRRKSAGSPDTLLEQTETTSE